MNQLKYIFFVALVAAFCANAGARPFGPDYGWDEVCAAASETSIEGECRQPVSHKDQP